jgi:hypothetical protein
MSPAHGPLRPPSLNPYELEAWRATRAVRRTSAPVPARLGASVIACAVSRGDVLVEDDLSELERRSPGTLAGLLRTRDPMALRPLWSSIPGWGDSSGDCGSVAAFALAHGGLDALALVLQSPDLRATVDPWHAEGYTLGRMAEDRLASGAPTLDLAFRVLEHRTLWSAKVTWGAALIGEVMAGVVIEEARTGDLRALTFRGWPRGLGPLPRRAGGPWLTDWDEFRGRCPFPT